MNTAYEGIHVLVDDNPAWKRDPIEQAQAACQGGAHVIQLRAKRAPDRQIDLWARTLRDMTREAGARFVVNDRFDIALEAQADAVHLGQDDIPPGEVRERVGDALQIGRSTHTIEEAVRARGEPVDYVAFGPVFGTTSKDSPYTARGVPALTEVVKALAPLPVVAIGGIDPSRLASLLAGGVRGIAVISQVAGSQDPCAATRELANAFHVREAVQP